ncbi:hypothetical protein [Cohnella sp.]|uniref:hypothetical protein n=1 Tax=Cohnella sp. TaxID=1883426 RepID=UPI003561D6AB
MTQLAHHDGVIAAGTTPNDLGIVLCKYCLDMIGTLPTNGFKKLYGVCDSEKCQCENRKENGHGR